MLLRAGSFMKTRRKLPIWISSPWVRMAESTGWRLT